MSSSTEKLCLNWNDFQKNISSSFQEMRDDLVFADVTLACEDKMQFQAHKIVLSASSSFFKKILRCNKHPHPLIYLKGIKAGMLESVLDFLYEGKVYIDQEDLSGFLVVAEELQLKGLTGHQSQENDALDKDEVKQMKTTPTLRDAIIPSGDDQLSLTDAFPTKNNTEIMKLESSEINTNNSGINKTIEGMLEKTGSTYNCIMCDHKSGHKYNMMKHIESKHTTGGEHPCKVCGKIFRFSNALLCHMTKNHKN